VGIKNSLNIKNKSGVGEEKREENFFFLSQAFAVQIGEVPTLPSARCDLTYSQKDS
jgi:hypothetical protein